MSSSWDRHQTYNFWICIWSVFCSPFKDGGDIFYNVPWKNVLCWSSSFFLFSFFPPSFSTLLTLRWPVFLTHSNSFLIAGHSFSSILHTHTRALFQLLVDTPHCLYFDFFFHLILVSLSFSFFLFQAFCLRIFLFSVWSWFIIRFLSIFSWIFVKTKTQGIIES